ncbi:MAG: hypothetical protein WBM44_21880 [Waterburya sp.]
MRLVLLLSSASWNTNVTVGSLNKGQVKRKFDKLIIGKTTGYTAQWLYRLLKKHCTINEQ